MTFLWKKLLLAGVASIVAHAPDDGEPIGIIELEGNLADVEKPPEIPAGSYVGEVQDIQQQTSGKGNPYFAIKFVIPTDELPPDLAEHYEEGAVLYWNRQVVPGKNDRRALFNLRKLIEALGLDSKTAVIDPNDWMGCKAKLRIVHEKYQGESRASIKAIEPAEATAPRASSTRGKRK